jgi:hypothetical protein
MPWLAHFGLYVFGKKLLVGCRVGPDVNMAATGKSKTATYCVMGSTKEENERLPCIGAK